MAAARSPCSSKIGAVVQLRSTLRVKKCWSRSIVTTRCSTRQVPMPFVPSYFSLHTAPVHKPQPSKVESSQAAPRRSTTTPSLSASSTEQPTPPTARNSRSMLACATRKSGPSRSLASSTSVMGSRCEGVRHAGSSACRRPDRRQDAASAERAASSPEITLRTRSAWSALAERPMLSSRRRCVNSPEHRALKPFGALCAYEYSGQSMPGVPKPQFPQGRPLKTVNRAGDRRLMRPLTQPV